MNYYRVINMTSPGKWEGEAKNAKEVYSQIKINKNDTTILFRKTKKDFKIVSVKDW